MICVRNRVFITGGADETGVAKAELDVYDLTARIPDTSRPPAGDRSLETVGIGKLVLPQGNPKRKAGHSVVVVINCSCLAETIAKNGFYKLFHHYDCGMSRSPSEHLYKYKWLELSQF